MSDILHALNRLGQSVWLDNIQRGMFASGELQRLIDAGLRGMTSNPTIFEKAISGSADYDEQLRRLVSTIHDPNDLFEACAIEDIRHACDAFRPLYDSSNGDDGYVSLEVSPLLSADTAGTIAAAQRLWKSVDRPNLMVKIPATPEGIPAIRATIGAGINVNVTLVFSLETYEAAARAYIDGLADRLAVGGSIDRLRSVNSVFVSRIDAAIDPMLEERGKAHPQLHDLRGKVAIANAMLIYERFRGIFSEERFTGMRSHGARPQRPLWASTGTKNPNYSDLLYVESLIGRDTVNTMPPATLAALMDHGTAIAERVTNDIATAHTTIFRLTTAGIDLHAVTAQLQREGVASFEASFSTLLNAIETKALRLRRENGGRLDARLGSTNLETVCKTAISRLSQQDFLHRLHRHDATLWSTDQDHATIIEHALGWLAYPERVLASVDDLLAFSDEVRDEFSSVVVLGMGGSSLAPDILRASFGDQPGRPRLRILDSSDPAQVRRLEASLDLKRSLFIVASKSGSTTEPDAFFRYFFDRVRSMVGEQQAPRHFIAITDPGTKLDEQATSMGLRRIFRNAPDIGGRYSALSLFGMVPAAIAGYDVRRLLIAGVAELQANAATSDTRTAPGVRLGAIFGALAQQGRNKLTIFTHPRVAAYGAWAEQLIAESTGKLGIGIVPIEGEPLGEVRAYGEDRLFVYVGAGLPQPDQATLDMLDHLEAHGQPTVRLRMDDLTDIGEQFALWEIATATAGSIMGIDAFDQPNVQESKDHTKRLLDEYQKRGIGRFDEPTPRLVSGSVAVMPLAGSRDLDLGDSLQSALRTILGQLRPGDYLAITAYMEMNEEHHRQLNTLRARLRDAYTVATTLGFGPRFLHSTGQLHKGGPNTGLFLQLTTEATEEIMIPGLVAFGTLERAQALGDFASLDGRQRRGARLHLANLAAGLRELSSAIDDAVATRA